MPVRVPACGPHNCDIAFVGEAPGETEVQTGVPFTGTSGKLLRYMMSKSGINPDRCYITNVIKERPPDNNIAHFIEFRGGTKGSVTEKEGYREYESELYEELSHVSANLIVALGNTPLYALCRLREIEKRRGSVYPSIESLGSRKVLPMIHPAAAARQYKYRYSIWFDMHKALRESRSPEISYLSREMIVLKDLDHILATLGALSQGGAVACDIEVVSGRLYCLALAPSPTLVYCIPFETQGPLWTPTEETQIFNALQEFLRSPSTTKVFHNAMFDVYWLWENYGLETYNYDDTMIAMGIAFPDFRKGLDSVASFFTSEPYYKDEGKLWKNWGGDPDSFFVYNMKDAAVTIESWTPLRAELEQQNNMATYNRHVQSTKPYMFMQQKGMRVDVEGIAQHDSSQELSTLQEQLDNIVGHHINPNSNKQVQTYFEHELGIEPYVGKNKKPTYDKTALKRLARRGYKAASIISQIRGVKKLDSSYFKVKLSDDNRLRGSINVVGTEYGRVSVSRMFSPTGDEKDKRGLNTQTMPKPFRKYVLADQGCLMVAVDLSQAELRIVAHVGRVQKMIQAFKDGTDLHALTATMIVNKPYEEISNVPGSSPLGNGKRSERDWGKQSNHAFNYDRGPKWFGLEYELPFENAQHIWSSYHALYPEVQANYHGDIIRQLRKNRTLTNLMGRRRVFYGKLEHDLFRSAYSFIPQSTVADMIKEWGILWLYDLPEVQLLNDEHDGLVFQIPVGHGWARIAEILRNLKHRMEQPLDTGHLTFSIPMEAKVGTNRGALEEVDLDAPDLVGILSEIYRRNRTPNPV